MKNKLILGLFLSLIVPMAMAKTFPLPAPGENVVGELETVQVMPGDDFIQLARRYDVGYYQLVEANPGVDPDRPIAETFVIIPNQYVLPNVPRKGIVVNLAELRLYYYPPGKSVVMTYPVGIGRQDWETPLGVHKIIERTVKPTWNVPESIRKARWEDDGVKLPNKVPPGPENPLGEYRLRLSNPSYLIHGTNDPSGVGRRSSAGCMRLFPEDIEALYPHAVNGTSVQIINMPYKAGWRSGKLYLEAHLPLEELESKLNGDARPMQQAINSIVNKIKAKVDWKLAEQVAKGEQGFPVVIGERG